MTYTVKHVYLDEDLPVSVIKDNNVVRFRFSESIRLRLQFPGRLHFSARATYFDKAKLPDQERWKTEQKSIPLKLVIKKPDGTPFTDDQITLNDIKGFRDLRGTSAEWTFSVDGESEPEHILEGFTSASVGAGHIRISVEEIVTSKSAPPLVNGMLMGRQGRRYQFDLFRVGTFTATAVESKMVLFDPDGVAVAERDDKLTFPVTLRTLDKSRDAEGNPRQWSLQVFPSTGKETNVWASVIETARIRTSLLIERINCLFGVGLSKLSIYGELDGSELVTRLKINDIVTAETMGMHGLLDSVIESVEQEAGVDKYNISTTDTYTLARKSREFDYGMKSSRFNMKVRAINIGIGASVKNQPSIPALKLEVIFDESKVTVGIGGINLAEAKIRDNRLQLEVGLRLNANGSFSPEIWTEEDPIDVDLDWTAVVGLGLTHPLILAGAKVAVEVIEEYYTDLIEDTFRELMTSVMKKVPQILAVILGDDFTYRSLQLDGDDILFEYIAPLEHEPRPSKNYEYLGIVGRSARQVGLGAWDIKPKILDTWSVQNLNKIDQIVVVMMENRSFDHVLGYRAQLPNIDSNGLTDELITFLESQGFPVRPLNKSAIERKTKFPRSVGHELADVTQQLKDQITLPSGHMINSPKGFIENFAHKHPDLNSHSTPKLEDVLGYYEANDLPFYKFLAENYAYCETFYCSHPGPTLPNRMFLLTGDVQYDRTGEAILDNNNGDNFYLSRAMTIFDLLSRKGVGWRVYESFPSVTMLRMFARYATDNTNIIDISRLQEDVAKGDLPAVTFIEPAMHHFPPNDDHPPADMYHGQLFLKGVYDTLRSNESLWSSTMLIITYDEHGGLYDHVIPPMADVLMRPLKNQEDLHEGQPHFTSPQMIINYGLRVPTFVVSPWSPAGKGPDIVLDHCSILKTIIARFFGQDKPFISSRVDASRSFDEYLSESEPRMNVPASPKMKPLPVQNPRPECSSIVTEPLSLQKLRSGNVDYHDITGMLARQLGR